MNCSPGGYGSLDTGAKNMRKEVSFFNIGTNPHGPVFRGGIVTIIPKNDVLSAFDNSNSSAMIYL